MALQIFPNYLQLFKSFCPLQLFIIILHCLAKLEILHSSDWKCIFKIQCKIHSQFLQEENLKTFFKVHHLWCSIRKNSFCVTLKLWSLTTFELNIWFMRLKLPVSLRGTPQGIGNSGFPEVKYPNVSEWKICSKLNPRSVLFSKVSNLGPPVGVKAGKRNKASALDHSFRRGAHRRVRAAVAQVVLVVCKLLLVSHNYCLGIYSILNLLYAKWTELCKV